ncbi:ankyrin repeat domain-containing protein [Pseudogemmobacter sonorensis]|uniref:ankyrin repeat domain-containing protein n=1 Tax=Pseudogemmobacter sonorensis TaxID=2989681 RepID=UPI0036899524
MAWGDTDMLRGMLRLDPGLATSVGAFGFQPMQLQDLCFEVEILDLLLANGAGIDSTNDEGMTILHLVTDPDAVPILAARGADLEARDQRGRTPPIAATMGQENGPNVVISLLEAGADQAARSQDRKTGLDIARMPGGDPEFLRVPEGVPEEVLEGR